MYIQRLSKVCVTLVGLSLSAVGYSSIVQAEVVVIGNNGSTATSLTEKQAKSLFLGKVTTLPGGESAKVTDQPEGSAIKSEFYEKVVKKNAKQLKGYWAKRIFTGKGAPPSFVSNDDAVKKWVAESPGNVGYISGSAADGSVKVLLSVP